MSVAPSGKTYVRRRPIAGTRQLSTRFATDTCELAPLSTGYPRLRLERPALPRRLGWRAVRIDRCEVAGSHRAARQGHRRGIQDHRRIADRRRASRGCPRKERALDDEGRPVREWLPDDVADPTRWLDDVAV